MAQPRLPEPSSSGIPIRVTGCFIFDMLTSSICVSLIIDRIDFTKKTGNCHFGTAMQQIVEPKLPIWQVGRDQYSFS
jgi:hypothetical protein